MSGVLFRIGEYWSDTELGERPIEQTSATLDCTRVLLQRLRAPWILERPKQTLGNLGLYAGSYYNDYEPHVLRKKNPGSSTRRPTGGSPLLFKIVVWGIADWLGVLYCSSGEQYSSAVLYCKLLL